MSKLALITGASSGIGAAIARLHARKGGDVILVARREAELQTLKKELEQKHKVKAHVFARDLSGKDAAFALFEDVKSAGLEVDFLINSAGFGGQGAHIERDLDKEIAMIDLNIEALMTLCHAFGRDMADRGYGKILNLGSSAGFMPGPNQAVYFATKAFVNSYSQALDQELREKGVTVTVLAPGYVETEFAKRADLEGTQLVEQSADTAENVARIGYEAMRAGELVTVNKSGIGIALRFIQPFMPRRAVLKLAQKMQAKAA